ncbi:hypothetical protein CRM91_09180 [Burkholderia ambifaria]|nr:hypothetical protein CRM91_09180 [Burkholderia ambifaria]
MSRWMALRHAGGCGAYATCCSRVVPEAGAPMSQTRHAFDRCRHRWRKRESRAGKRPEGSNKEDAERAGRRGRPVRAIAAGRPAGRARVIRPGSRG